jgi:hypothetical protein
MGELSVDHKLKWVRVCNTCRVCEPWPRSSVAQVWMQSFSPISCLALAKLALRSTASSAAAAASCIRRLRAIAPPRGVVFPTDDRLADPGPPPMEPPATAPAPIAGAPCTAARASSSNWRAAEAMAMEPRPGRRPPSIVQGTMRNLVPIPDPFVYTVKATRFARVWRVGRAPEPKHAAVLLWALSSGGVLNPLSARVMCQTYNPQPNHLSERWPLLQLVSSSHQRTQHCNITPSIPHSTMHGEAKKITIFITPQGIHHPQRQNVRMAVTVHIPLVTQILRLAPIEEEEEEERTTTTTTLRAPTPSKKITVLLWGVCS